MTTSTSCSGSLVTGFFVGLSFIAGRTGFAVTFAIVAIVAGFAIVARFAVTVMIAVVAMVAIVAIVAFLGFLVASFFANGITQADAWFAFLFVIVVFVGRSILAMFIALGTVFAVFFGLRTVGRAGVGAGALRAGAVSRG